MLRSLPRASSSSASLLAGSTTRRYLQPFRTSPVSCLHASRQQQQSRQAHAISNPTLAGIEKRWEAMPPQEQADLWMSLRDRMKADWHELTMQEKKAGKLHAHFPTGLPSARTAHAHSLRQTNAV
ncbi:Cytochrome c oxidase subunit 5A [Acarospora aff. strigata]|nr:Cytochrome c oxidase subunit 5A [Acarospora aff. strigata]